MNKYKNAFKERSQYLRWQCGASIAMFLCIWFMAAKTVYADDDDQARAHRQAKEFLDTSYKKIDHMVKEIENESFLSNMPKGWKEFIASKSGQAQLNNLSKAYITKEYEAYRWNVLAWQYWARHTENPQPKPCYALAQLREKHPEYTDSGAHGTIARRDATQQIQFLQRVDNQSHQQLIKLKNVQNWDKDTWGQELQELWNDFRAWYASHNAEILSASVFEGTYCKTHEWAKEYEKDKPFYLNDLIIYGIARKTIEIKGDPLQVLEDLFLSLGAGGALAALMNADKITHGSRWAAEGAVASKIGQFLAKLSLGAMGIGAVGVMTEMAHLYHKRHYVELGELIAWGEYQLALISVTLGIGSAMPKLPKAPHVEGMQLNGFFAPPKALQPTFFRPAKVPPIKAPVPTKPLAPKSNPLDGITIDETWILGPALRDQLHLQRPEEPFDGNNQGLNYSSLQPHISFPHLSAIDKYMKEVSITAGVSKGDLYWKGIYGAKDVVGENHRHKSIEAQAKKLAIRQIKLINLNMQAQNEDNPKKQRHVAVK